MGLSSVSQPFLVATLNAVLTLSNDPNFNNKSNYFILQLYLLNVYELSLLYFSLYLLLLLYVQLGTTGFEARDMAYNILEYIH